MNKTILKINSKTSKNSYKLIISNLNWLIKKIRDSNWNSSLNFSIKIKIWTTFRIRFATTPKDQAKFIEVINISKIFFTIWTITRQTN